MEYIQGKVNFSQEKEGVITLGKFDGVHIGHQKLINEMLKAKNGRESIVFTFDVPPVPGQDTRKPEIRMSGLPFRIIRAFSRRKI